MELNNNEIKNYAMDTEDEAIIFETSLVAEPASGFEFLAFSKDKDNNPNKITIKNKPNLQKYSTSNKMRMLSGIWFQPEQKISRYNEFGEEYTTSISAEALRDALIKYLKNNNHQNYLLEHEGDFLEEVVDIENWIYTNENDRSPVFKLSIEDLGYSKEEIEFGSVIKTVYINSEKFWNDYIETGIVKGFSIGGLFNLNDNSINNQYNNKFNKMQEKEIKEDLASDELLKEVSKEDTNEKVTLEEIKEEKEDKEEKETFEEETIMKQRFDELSYKLGDLDYKINAILNKLEIKLQEDSKTEEALKQAETELVKAKEEIQNFKKQTIVSEKSNILSPAKREKVRYF